MTRHLLFSLAVLHLFLKCIRTRNVRKWQQSLWLWLRMLHTQEWLDTQCRDTVSLVTPSTWLHAWNQLEKVEFILTLTQLPHGSFYSVSRKKRPECFFVISSIKLWLLWWRLVHRFQNKFASQCLNVSHLTWIISLHYLVKHIGHVLPLSWYKKKLQNLSHLNCGLQFAISSFTR